MSASSPIAFPDGFAWGVATASYQIEGAVDEDGRSASIWDTFSHTPGAIANGDTGDVACDHYHRFREDVERMADIGVGWYRFSIAWPRVMPSGRGELNPKGVDFYARLIDALREHGIQPWVTLYHWDLPQVLQDAGGWPARDTAERFAEYAAAMHDRFRDRVRWWTTLNEPWVAAFLGHAAGVHAPGIRDGEAALRAAHHLLLGHGLALDAMRAQDDGSSRFGVTLVLHPALPASESEADKDAARRIDGLQNRMFLDPLLRGRYPDDVRGDVSRVSNLAHVRDGDEAQIAVPLDFLGINYYSRNIVRGGGDIGDEPSPWVGSEDVEFVFRGLPRTEMGWEIDPDGLHEILTRIGREYGPVPLYVTENGGAFPDEPGPDGSIADDDRIEYLKAHFRAALRAIADGADLRGYFVWSFLDNFEWAYGYGKRFGLVHVDYETQRRTPKASAAFFREVARANALA